MTRDVFLYLVIGNEIGIAAFLSFWSLIPRLELVFLGLPCTQDQEKIFGFSGLG